MSYSVKETTPLLETKSEESKESIPMTVVTMNPTATHSTATSKERLVSLDQFRGFVILCSFFVPLLGDLNAAPDVFKHKHNFLSLADCTMPQFYVAIGFAMQLTLLRLRAKKGMRAVIIKQLQRTRTLYVIALLTDGIDRQNDWADFRANWPKIFLQFIYGRNLYSSLAIIGVAQLLIVPVITRPVWIRACYMIAAMTIFLVAQWTFYMKFEWKNVINGGSLGAFSWTFPMLCGTFLNDWNEWIRKIPASNFTARKRRVIKGSIGLLVVAGLCWLVAYLVSSLPASWSPICFKLNDEVIPCPNTSLPSIPFVPPKIDVISIWTMSHRLASFTIRLASVGYALLVYFFWFIMSDIYNYQFSFLTTLSTHSLLMYILRDLGFKLANTIIPSDSPLFMLPVLLLIGVSSNIIIALYINRNNINLRL